MAGVQTTLALNDRLTGPLMKMIRAMDATIRVMEKMDASATQLDTKGLAKARKAIMNASADLERLMVASKQADSSLGPLGSKFANLPPPVDRATNSVKSFFAAFAGSAAAYMAIETLRQGIQTFVQASDAYVSTSARLANINDGLQTQAELQEKVYQAAQRSRSGYVDMANSVAKLGSLASDAFGNTDEIIRFSELMGKAFAANGISKIGRESAMYQLTQSMGAGRLQGEEYNSIAENAGFLLDAIAKMMKVPKGELKNLASEGKITADIVKAALFKAADDIEKKFKNMPLTFADAMTMFKNWSLRAFEPLLIRFNQFVNSDAFATMAEHAMFFVNVFIKGMDLAFDALEFFYRMIGAFGRFFEENWSWIAPILTVIGSVLAGIGAILLGLAAKWLIVKTATMIAAAAQWVYNTAMLSSPATWVLLAIIALLGFVAYATVRWGEQTAEVIGVIFGLFASLGAFVWNIIANIWNLFAMVAEFIMNVFFDPVYAVKKLFYDMVKMVIDNMAALAGSFDTAANFLANAFVKGANIAIGAVNGLIKALNMIPGVNIGTIGKLSASSVGSLSGGLKNFAANLKPPTSSEFIVNIPRMNRFNVPQAFHAGYAAGNKMSKWLSDKTANLLDKTQKLAEGIKKGNPFSQSLGSQIANSPGMKNPLASGKDDKNPTGGKLDKVGKIDDEINIADEDLQVFKELATIKSIQNFITLTPTVQVQTGDIRNEVDVDQLVRKFEESMVNEIARSAEGVYA
ncbi:tape measure domain-containing protein [Anoxybacillus ayderensis]|uniref:tape measure protein n=1 Tax=Anoxybacillus sp. ST70 TaxID=2864180 RepID=UPI0002EDAD58|nr:tape measure protein [Anoxybacillus sp. ST70]AXM89388.1 tape measure domain-containing protein [Anoxybacillus ayderensis G10]MBW9219408.1 tape measure protein [Anoxybacillus sp. ST70]THD16149.1 tape measure domain-containing protein [Anoxybacillus ayderensis]